MTKEGERKFFLDPRQWFKEAPSLTELVMDDTTIIVCRPNITNTFTRDKDTKEWLAHTFLFLGDHGERKNGKQIRTFKAERGKAEIVINGMKYKLRRGQSIEVPADAEWNIFAVGGLFEYTVRLPENFDPTTVLGDIVKADQLPDIKSIPFAGPFTYLGAASSG